MDFISHCIKEKKWRFGSRAMLGMLSILTAFSLLGWIYLTQASHVAMTSRHVQELEEEKSLLQEQNLQLMAEIAEQESVARLAARAQEMGFVHITAQDVQFLAVTDRQEEGEVWAEASSVEDWWADVAAQFAAWVKAEGQ